ncbi:MAG: CMP deaminase, partial [Polaribacter sp.]
SKLIHQAGIKRVVYANAYKDDAGIKFLEKAGIEIINLPYE